MQRPFLTSSLVLCLRNLCSVLSAHCFVVNVPGLVCCGLSFFCGWVEGSEAIFITSAIFHELQQGSPHLCAGAPSALTAWLHPPSPASCQSLWTLKVQRHKQALLDDALLDLWLQAWATRTQWGHLQVES